MSDSVLSDSTFLWYLIWVYNICSGLSVLILKSQYGIYLYLLVAKNENVFAQTVMGKNTTTQRFLAFVIKKEKKTKKKITRT